MPLLNGPTDVSGRVTQDHHVSLGRTAASRSAPSHHLSVGYTYEEPHGRAQAGCHIPVEGSCWVDVDGMGAMCGV